MALTESKYHKNQQSYQAEFFPVFATVAEKMCLSYSKAIKQPIKKGSSKDVNPALPELIRNDKSPQEF